MGSLPHARARHKLPPKGVASAVSSTYPKSWKVGFARRCEARARARRARWAGGGAVATLASLCARLSASKGSERLVCEALVAALGGTHGVEHVPRGRAEGRAAARGRADGSRPRAASRAAPGPASVVVAGAAPGAAHSAERAWAAKRGPLDGMRVVRCVRRTSWGAKGRRAARSSRGRGGGALSAHARPCEGQEHAPWRHEGALWEGGVKNKYR